MVKEQREKSGFLFKGGKTGVLLVHGLTGTPGEMKALGEGLNRKGYTVKGVLLAGHGTNMSDLQESSWRDWLATVEKETYNLKRRCQRVFLVGLSVGGLLGLFLSSFHRVDGVVTLNAPIFLKDKRYYWAPITRYLLKYKTKDSEGILDKTNYKAFALKQIPTKTLADYFELSNVLKKQLNEVNSPTLIIQSHFDKVIESQSAQYIYQNVACKEKSIEYFSKSGHLITLGPEKELLLERIVQFFKKIEETN